MSTTKTPPAQPVQQKHWLDYGLMFVCIPILHKKYPARSQEPIHRVTVMIVYMLKTPVQALSVYLLGEHVFQRRLPSQFETYLFIGIVIAFWELVAHRLLHLNKYTLRLLKERHIRQRTEAFMKRNPDLSLVLIAVNMLLIIAYLVFFGIYMAIVIITPVNPRGY